MFILVKPEKDKRGIVIFNHKEVLRGQNFGAVEKHKDRWIIGFNNGGWLGGHSKKIKDKYNHIFDFYISPIKIIDHSKCIPFCGSSFINREFCIRKEPISQLLSKISNRKIVNFVSSLHFTSRRVIDLIVLGRFLPTKNIPQLIDLLYEIRNKVKINILINSFSKTPINSKLKMKIEELNKKPNIFCNVYTDFTSDNLLKEPEVINLLNISKFGYNNNKQEGNCRLIQECMLCGCVPVINKNMIGGLKEHYFKWNTVDWSIFKRNLENNDFNQFYNKNYNIDKIVNYSKINFNEKYTIDNLKNYLNKKFNTNFRYYDTENLAKKLPSHMVQNTLRRYFSTNSISFEFYNPDTISKALKHCDLFNIY